MLLQLGIPCLWTIIMIISLVIVKTDKKFKCALFSGTGYRVDTSPSLSWSKTSGWAITVGFIFLGLMWVVFILLITDAVTFNEKSNGATWMVLAPTALSAIFFFSGYSSRLVNNYVQVDKDTFNSWVKSGAIERKAGDNYVDVEGDLLLHLFDNKIWIK